VFRTTRPSSLQPVVNQYQVGLLSVDRDADSLDCAHDQLTIGVTGLTCFFRPVEFSSYAVKNSRPHRQDGVDAAYCYKILSLDPKSVCLRVGHIVSPTKTAESIETPFERGVHTRVSSRNDGL